LTTSVWLSPPQCEPPRSRALNEVLKKRPAVVISIQQTEHFPSKVIQFARLVPQIRDRVAELRLHSGKWAGNRPVADFNDKRGRQRSQLNPLLPETANKSRLE
jgi:hypothetical protein